jgi:transcriptional regulator with XRE-family HTH domain
VGEYGREVTMLVAGRIHDLRNRQGMSMEQLAKLAGLHRTSISLIERGKRGLTVEASAEIARALGVALSELLASPNTSSAIRP